MYKEELGDADMDSNSSSETAAAKTSGKASMEDGVQGTGSTGQVMEAKCDQMKDVDMMGSDANSIFQSDYGIGKSRENNEPSMIFPNGVNERFMEAAAAYHMSGLERFGGGGGGSGGGGGVSLTLGLQQGEGGGRMAIGDSTQNGFIPLTETDVYNTTTGSAMGTEAAEFDCLDSGNRHHRLVSSLLPSFT